MLFLSKAALDGLDGLYFTLPSIFLFFFFKVGEKIRNNPVNPVNPVKSLVSH
jgi:hypothetical protein